MERLDMLTALQVVEPARGLLQAVRLDMLKVLQTAGLLHVVARLQVMVLTTQLRLASWVPRLPVALGDQSASFAFSRVLQDQVVYHPWPVREDVRCAQVDLGALSWHRESPYGCCQSARR